MWTVTGRRKRGCHQTHRAEAGLPVVAVILVFEPVEALTMSATGSVNLSRTTTGHKAGPGQSP